MTRPPRRSQSETPVGRRYRADVIATGGQLIIAQCRLSGRAVVASKRGCGEGRRGRFDRQARANEVKQFVRRTSTHGGTAMWHVFDQSKRL